MSRTFDTELDRPVAPLTLPATVKTGGGAAIQVCDGFVRGTGIVGRFSASPGLIGIKVATDGPVRVTLRLTADRETAQWWQHRVPDRVTPRQPHGARLLLVRSQGATRTAVLLDRPHGSFALDASATVRFDLTAEEVPADGLLILELADATAAPDGTLPHAAVGVRVDAVTVDPVPAEDRPAGDRPVEDLATGPVAGGVFLAAPAAPVSGTFVWTLRAGPAATVPADRVAPPAGPLWEEPPTGAPRLRYRDKGIALARRRLAAARFAASNRARRGMIRGARAVTAPVRYGLAPLTVRTALRPRDVHAQLVPLDGGTPRACAVRVRGNVVQVRYTGHLSGPAVVRLSTYRPVAWRMVAASVTRPASVTPELTDDAEANRALVQELLDRPDAAPVTLPAGRFPVGGGLRLADGRHLTGARDGDTVLIQPDATAAPLLWVLGSGVRVADLALELPVADPGKHDGDRWTAVTVGRYFYPERPEWATDVELRNLTVRRAGRCTANSVAVLGAVRDLTVADVRVSGGGTGVAVHWGAVGTSVSELTGPSYHPHRLRITGLRVTDAFEGFYLSSVHDVAVRDVRCTGVEIGFRLLPGDNADRFHPVSGASPVSSAITVSGCTVGWCGPYAMRLAGWGRSEVDGRTSHLAYRDVTVTDCALTTEPALPDAPDRTRAAVVLERADGIVLSAVRLADGGPEIVAVRRDGVDSGPDVLAGDLHGAAPAAAEQPVEGEPAGSDDGDE
ncbi:hypothetical protein [Actinocatenispora rupis]|uniref:Uncharacterized protein n=1 Tax=Actinocatenispora rupis TaxID=519421 RepID=A0A8J3IZI6_9ACTN|nr:hypothetical protein [Actinocatenispora rupis]GID11453.1 hypothetical protein Aru02nite_23420 [Actinocatenispora rupis]